jgi:peptidyl-prolyl cis-trans isomerase B (cyclophilin B)
MATKKQARATQKRRQEQLQHKLVARQARRRRRQQIVGAVSVGALVLSGGVLAAVSGTGRTPGSDPAPSTTITLSTEPSPQPTLGFPHDLAAGREWTGTITLDQGTIGVSLDGAAAPLAVSSFVYLAQQGFFDGTECHRLLNEGSAYALQCGDPDGSDPAIAGTGGPGYGFGPVENAPLDDWYPTGTIAMARAQDNGFSQGSQFFIVYQDSQFPSDTAGGYTVFGHVTDGLDIVEAIGTVGTATGETGGRPAEPVVLREVSVS